MKKTNKKGFGLIIAMGLVMVMSLLAILIFEYIIPVARNVKGMENASKAYYQASIGVEDSLWFISQNPIGSSASTNYLGNNVDYKYEIVSSGSLIPPASEGNSEYDTDRNTISEGSPIQLEIGHAMISDVTSPSIQFDFRVPDLDLNTISDEALEGVGTKIYIHWQLSSETDSLNASGSFITQSEITGGAIELIGRNGENLGQESETLVAFYATNCGVGNSCKLKLSIIDHLVESSGENVPYLEWKANFNANVIPLRYARIYSDGKSFGYKKDLDIAIPQQTVIEAFDFTVFQ